MPRNVGDYLVTGRSLAEYRAMFALTDADLAGRVLDCPGGAASFVAEVTAAGGDAVAADPAYALPPADLAARATGDADRTTAFLSEHRAHYVWDFYGDLDTHHRCRVDAAAAFAAHRAADPARYVAASLPGLPFRDATFDLVLSSHLLFTYADRLDSAFHLAALAELARVGTEVRIYPLLPHDGRTYDLAALRADLAATGVGSELRAVPFEFQRGAREMLVLGPMK